METPSDNDNDNDSEEMTFVLQDDAAEHVQKHDEESSSDDDLAQTVNGGGSRWVKLSLRYFNVAPQPLNKRLIALCPTTEVVALAATPKSVQIIRIDGQHISTTNRPASSATVCGLEWTPSGRVLLITWSDNLIQATLPARKGHIVESATLKEDQEDNFASNGSGDRSADGQGHITLLNCVESVIDASLVKYDNVALKQQPSKLARSAGRKSLTVDEWDKLGELEIEDLLRNESSISDADLLSAVVDLPRRIALLNVASELPRLSIPPDVDDPEIPIRSTFLSTQEGVDTMINRKAETDPAKNTVDVILASWSSGRIAVHVNFGSLKLLQTSYSDRSRSEEDVRQVVKHASHSFSRCHLLLQKPKSKSEEQQGGLCVSVLSLDGIRRSSPFVNLLLDLESSLDWMVSYILKTVIGLREYWRSSQDLPTRFMANISETLEENNSPIDLITALYELAVTGHCIPAVKEWLKDDLAERGYKRWQKAATEGYEKIRQAVHENLLPVLDRASVTASRLRVLARTPNIPMFDVEESVLTGLLDQLDIMRVIGHHLLSHCSTETRQVAVFLEWLHCQIQVLSAESGDSQMGQEAAMKAAGLDHALLLAYLTGALTRSHLNVFLGRTTNVIVAAARSSSGEYSNKKTVVRLLERHRLEATQPTSHAVELKNLLYQALHVQKTCEGIYSTARKGFGKSADMLPDIQVDLEPARTDILDMKMVYEVYQGAETLATYLLSIPVGKSNVLNIYHMPHSACFSEKSGNLTPAKRSISFRAEEEIKHFQFLDDDFLLVLVADRNHSRLLHVPYSTRLANAATAPTPAAWDLFDSRLESRITGEGRDDTGSAQFRSGIGGMSVPARLIRFAADPHAARRRKASSNTTTAGTPRAARENGAGSEGEGVMIPTHVTQLHIFCHHDGIGDFVPAWFCASSGSSSGTSSSSTSFNGADAEVKLGPGKRGESGRRAQGTSGKGDEGTGNGESGSKMVLILDKDGTRFRAGKILEQSMQGVARSE